MKRLLICVLAIAMMLSSVAFAKNESAYVNFEEKDEILLPPGGYTVNKDSALKIGVEQNGPNSTIAIEADPKEENGQVVKFINPAYSSLNADNKNTAKVVSTFQDPDMVNGVYGTTSNINFGFSFYAPVAIENQTSDVYFYVNFKYRDDSSNEDFVILQTKSGVISSRINKTITKELSDKWYDLRFDIDIKNKVVKTYLDDVLFSSDTLPSALDGVRYATIATVVEESFTNEQVVYFDNFFVNETPELLHNVEYSTCYMDVDFHGSKKADYEFPYNTINTGTANVSKAEQSDGVLKFTFNGALSLNVPSLASNNVSSRNAGDYLNGDYMFEIDVKFSNFSGESKFGYLKYNLEGNTSNSDTNTHPAVFIDNNGMLNVGEKDNYQPVENGQLVADKWYNFKFHYKARQATADGKNKGLLVDVYFQDKLVGENIYITDGDKCVKTIRSINFQSGTATAARTIYADNAKFYAVNKVGIAPVKIVDVEVSNASGDLISSSYGEGEKTVTAYVTSASVSELAAGNATLIVARYASANGCLLGVKAVPAGAITKDTLTKVTANLDVTDMHPDEFIKVMIVDSTNTLTPYIKPVTLSVAQ